MRFHRVLLGFSTMTDAVLESTAKSILSILTNNPDFPSTKGIVAELEASLPVFIAAREAADKSEAVVLTVNKNEARNAIILILTITAMYVNGDARGVLSVLSKSGFPLAVAKALLEIGRPEGLTLSPGKSTGLLVAKFTVARGVSKYVYEICTAEPTASTIWMRFPHTRKNFTFEGLIPGNKYWVRVSVKDSNGVTLYSDVVSMFVS